MSDIQTIEARIGRMLRAVQLEAEAIGSMRQRLEEQLKLVNDLSGLVPGAHSGAAPSPESESAVQAAAAGAVQADDADGASEGAPAEDSPSDASETPRETLIDATLRLAAERGTAELRTMQVLEWMKASGYRSRIGRVPTRGSVYMALQQALEAGLLTKGDKRGLYLIVGESGSAAPEPEAAPQPTGETLIEAVRRLAAEQNAPVFTAAGMHQWMIDDGYRSRVGRVPTRNSVYTALMNALGSGELERTGTRGEFRFVTSRKRKGRRAVQR